MNRLLQLGLLAVIGYGAYMLVQNQYPEYELKDLPGQPVMRGWVASLQARFGPEPEPEPEPPPPPQWPKTSTFTCPTCEGEGRLTYVNRRGENKTYACPICGSSGQNTLRNMPEGSYICPDCKGMQRIEKRVERRDAVGSIIDAEHCQRCGGVGYIVPRTGPGSRGETRGVDTPSRAR